MQCLPRADASCTGSRICATPVKRVHWLLLTPLLTDNNAMPELAYAAAPSGGSPWSMFLLLGGFFVLMYFMVIRPQGKRRKEHQALMAALSKGDEVVTVGGVTGTITKVEEDFVKVRIAERVEVRVQKASVQASLPKGTLKSLDDA